MKRILALLTCFFVVFSLIFSVSVFADDIKIEIGKPVTGQLLDQTEADIYRFTLEESGSVGITFEYPAECGNYAFSVMLYSGNTRYINAVNVHTSAVSGETRVWEIDPCRFWAGEYYVLVKNPNARAYTNDDYKLTVNFIPESADEYEKEMNNNWNTANAIPFNKEIKGNLAIANDADYSKIELPYDGTIQVKFRYPENYEGAGWKVALSFVSRPWIEIQTEIIDKTSAKAKDGFYEYDFRKVRVPKGSYCIAISPADKADLSDEEYLLTANIADESEIPHEKEKNNSFEAATELPLNEKLLANLESKEDADYYKFTLAEASDITLYSFYTPGQPQKSWELVMYDKDKKRIDYTYNNNAGDLEDGMKKMRLIKEALPAGQYYASVMAPVGGGYSYADYYIMVENKNAPAPEKEEPKQEENNSTPKEEKKDEQFEKTGVPTVKGKTSLPEIDYSAIEKAADIKAAGEIIAKYYAGLSNEQKTTFAALSAVQSAAEYAYSCFVKTEADKIINKDTILNAKGAVSDISVPAGVKLVREKELTATITAKTASAVIKADCKDAGIDSVIVKFNGASIKVPVKDLEQDITVGIGNKGESFDVSVSGTENAKLIIPKEATVIKCGENAYPAIPQKNGTVTAPAPESGIYEVVNSSGVVFNDISGLSEEYKTAISDMSKRGIINGVDTGKFDPSGTLTRAQTVKLIVAALGLCDESLTEDFSDVKESDWHYHYVATGAKYGFVNGYPDGTFVPDSSIAKQELTKVFAEVMKTYGGYKYPDNREAYLNFSDAETLGDWAKPYMAFMAQSEILPFREDGKLKAADGITRAEAALMLYRMFELL